VQRAPTSVDDKAEISIDSSRSQRPVPPTATQLAAEARRLHGQLDEIGHRPTRSDGRRPVLLQPYHVKLIVPALGWDLTPNADTTL
jgi:hypothetical protein